MSDAVILISGLVGLALWVVVTLKWQRGFQGLLLYLPFAGAVTLYLFPSKLPLLYKDLFFVVPAYLSFFLFHTRQLRNAPLPPAVLLAMLSLAALVLLQMVNPSIENWLVALIGAKVWLFYMPLAFLAGAAVVSRGDLVKLLRLMVVVSIFPVVVGVYQWFGSATVGFQETMSFFYGDVASQATQGFGSFRYGGDYFRIPSTFTFVSQYFGYTWAMIAFAYALVRVDPSLRWRRFALIMLAILIVAAMLSGSRAAVVFVPLLLVLTVVLDGRVTGIFAGLALVPMLMLAALYLGGIDPVALIQETGRLASSYSREIVYESIVNALINNPLGSGTGMNTGAARYAFPARMAPILLESYYAKAIVELGVVGLFVVLGLFLAIILQGYHQLRRIREPALKGCAATMVAFFISVAIHSGKGWQVDVDPINVYFWVMVGILFKLPYLQASAPAAVRGSRTLLHPAQRRAAALGRTPAAMPPSPRTPRPGR